MTGLFHTMFLKRNYSQPRMIILSPGDTSTSPLTFPKPITDKPPHTLFRSASTQAATAMPLIHWTFRYNPPNREPRGMVFSISRYRSQPQTYFVGSCIDSSRQESNCLLYLHPVLMFKLDGEKKKQLQKVCARDALILDLTAQYIGKTVDKKNQPGEMDSIDVEPMRVKLVDETNGKVLYSWAKQRKRATLHALGIIVLLLILPIALVVIFREEPIIIEEEQFGQPAWQTPVISPAEQPAPEVSEAKEEKTDEAVPEELSASELPLKIEAADKSSESPDLEIAEKAEPLYVVQVAIYKHSGPAERLKEQLESEGCQTEIFVRTSATKTTWYKVYVGQFSKRTEGEITLEKIKRMGFEDAFIRRREKK